MREQNQAIWSRFCVAPLKGRIVFWIRRIKTEVQNKMGLIFPVECICLFVI